MCVCASANVCTLCVLNDLHRAADDRGGVVDSEVMKNTKTTTDNRNTITGQSRGEKDRMV